MSKVIIAVSLAVLLSGCCCVRLDSNGFRLGWISDVPLDVPTGNSVLVEDVTGLAIYW